MGDRYAAPLADALRALLPDWQVEVLPTANGGMSVTAIRRYSLFVSPGQDVCPGSIARNASALGWLPIDSAPKDGRWFLTYTPDNDTEFFPGLDFAKWDEESGAFVKVGCGFQYATLWQPLAAGPAR